MVSKSIPIPPHYDGWEHHLLDIDPAGGPEIVCDAREMHTLPASSYDAVYCSHNLEHYYRHDVPKVLAGFRHVLKDPGFAHLRVPDMGDVMRQVVQKSMDIDDVLYQSQAGPITVRDVFYGYGVEIERSGNEFFAHKTGFTQKSLVRMLESCGFPFVFSMTGNLEVAALAFKQKPDDFARSLFGLPAL